MKRVVGTITLAQWRKPTEMHKKNGGEIGIRTLGTVTGTPHFECGAFDHSAISPQIIRTGRCR